MNNMKIKEINLYDSNERKEYSLKLSNFEQQFSYPLGTEFFNIQHGQKNDYFSFFEKLGTPKIIVLENSQDIIGVVISVLREINNKQYWYLCDFKINKKYQGIAIYRPIINDFLKLYYNKQFESLFAVNMNEPKNNKMFTYLRFILKDLTIKITPNYLYSFKGSDLNKFSEDFWREHIIVSNNGCKDIVINNEPLSLFHIVKKEHFTQNLHNFESVIMQDINPTDSVMLLNYDKLDLSFGEESVISLLSKGDNEILISSAEI